MGKRKVCCHLFPPSSFVSGLCFCCVTVRQTIEAVKPLRERLGGAQAFRVRPRPSLRSRGSTSSVQNRSECVDRTLLANSSCSREPFRLGPIDCYLLCCPGCARHRASPISLTHVHAIMLRTTVSFLESYFRLDTTVNHLKFVLVMISHPFPSSGHSSFLLVTRTEGLQVATRVTFSLAFRCTLALPTHPSAQKAVNTSDSVKAAISRNSLLERAHKESFEILQVLRILLLSLPLAAPLSHACRAALDRAFPPTSSSILTPSSSRRPRRSWRRPC